jgi:hypothetical protein
MATAGGPNLVRNSLAANLDAGNKNSYYYGGTTWNDLSGNNVSGSLIDGPALNSGNSGNIVFDGINSYIDCGTSIQLTNNFTLCTWLKDSNTGYIIDQGLIGTDPTGCVEWTNYGLALGSNNISTVYADGTIIPSKWNNIVCTFSSSTASFYINGVLDSVKITTFSNFTPSGTLKIARRGFNTSGIFLGKIANTLIYNRVLSAAEVAQNYNAQKSRFENISNSTVTFVTLNQAASIGAINNSLEYTAQLPFYPSYASANAFSLVIDP